jgi:AAA15 family ATPase/GTPase
MYKLQKILLTLKQLKKKNKREKVTGHFVKESRMKWMQNSYKIHIIKICLIMQLKKEIVNSTLFFVIKFAVHFSE